MQIQIVTTDEAKLLGLAHSIMTEEGHGAFGEPDNSYANVVYLDNKQIRLSDDDLVMYMGEQPNREIIQVLSEWNCSDKLLSIMNPEALTKRKKDRQRKLLALQKEIENDNK